MRTTGGLADDWPRDADAVGDGRAAENVLQVALARCHLAQQNAWRG
jgi:hypothetical protein